MWKEEPSRCSICEDAFAELYRKHQEDCSKFELELKAQLEGTGIKLGTVTPIMMKPENETPYLCRETMELLEEEMKPESDIEIELNQRIEKQKQQIAELEAQGYPSYVYTPEQLAATSYKEKGTLEGEDAIKKVYTDSEGKMHFPPLSPETKTPEQILHEESRKAFSAKPEGEEAIRNFKPEHSQISVPPIMESFILEIPREKTLFEIVGENNERIEYEKTLAAMKQEERNAELNYLKSQAKSATEIFTSQRREIRMLKDQIKSQAEHLKTIDEELKESLNSYLCFREEVREITKNQKKTNNLFSIYFVINGLAALAFAAYFYLKGV